MADLVSQKSIILNAPLPRVWEALTNPELTKKYFYNCEVISDWKVGSPIIYREETIEKVTDHVTGTITAIIPGTMFSYEFKSERSGVTLKVTFEFLHTIDGATELVVRQDCGTDQQACDDSNQGWEFVLKGLKDLVEA